jgi:transcriptional regulator with XRE-family HTH domain
MMTIPASRHVRPITRAVAQARAAGVPAYAIAREANISQALLSMIVNGRAPVTRATGEKIAQALGVDVNEIFPELSAAGA